MCHVCICIGLLQWSFLERRSRFRSRSRCAAFQVKFIYTICIHIFLLCRLTYPLGEYRKDQPPQKSLYVQLCAVLKLYAALFSSGGVKGLFAPASTTPDPYYRYSSWAPCLFLPPATPKSRTIAEPVAGSSKKQSLHESAAAAGVVLCK